MSAMDCRTAADRVGGSRPVFRFGRLNRVLRMRRFLPSVVLPLRQAQFPVAVVNPVR
jgi:hypothetical protein